MKFLLILSLSLFYFSANAMNGFVYEIGSDKKKVLFIIERKLEKNGKDGVFSIIHKTPDGKVAVSEAAEFSNEKLTRYKIDYVRRNESGEIKIVGNKVHFSYTKDGKTKTSEEKLKDNFVIGPTINVYLHKHWQKLLDGKEVDVRFGVDYRRDTVGFSFKRVKKKEKSKDEMVLIMKPTSFVISAIVDPIFFTYDIKTKKLKSFKGRAKPKKLVKGQWKDLDALTVYE